MTTNEAPARYFGRCFECRKRMVVEAAEHELVSSYARNLETGKFVYCPDCGVHKGQVHFKVIKATLAPEKRCDAKCRLSVAETCKCSCGGAEHGAGATARHPKEKR